MSYRSQKALLVVAVFVALCSRGSRGQEKAGWRISPEKINIQAGSRRTVQILDENAQELRGALWAVDQADLAEIVEENGRATLLAKAPGTIRISASLGGETKSSRIRIWPADKPLPGGTTNWGMHPIGREIGDLSGVPTGGSVSTFSLEQTAGGSTYLRGVTDEGIQEWAWLMPEQTRAVELVCGDWLGGALVAADRGDAFTLYVVGNDGRLRWHRAFAGNRKSHAYNTDHLLHIVTESPDGAAAVVSAMDGATGEQRFALPIPASREHLNRVRRSEAGFLCASDNTSSPARAAVSQLFVNIDGLAYVAFAHGDRSLSAGACAPGAVVKLEDVAVSGKQRLALWQIHPDGTRQEIAIEEIESGAVAPTGELIPDGLGGVLLSVRRSPEEFLYRVDGDGKLVYKLALPAYDGPLKDTIVLGENNRGFTTRGSLLIAFDAEKGKESWRWDSGVRGIEAFAALADGACLVQTPDALVYVLDADHVKEVMKGQAMMGWNGQLYRKH